jgi:hypothetical protein
VQQVTAEEAASGEHAGDDEEDGGGLGDSSHAYVA